MNTHDRTHRLAGLLAAAALLATPAALPLALSAQPASTVDPSLYAGLRWRSIGPYRGGRAVAVAGVRGDARTFYLGAVGGGVWKSENAGRTWAPILDGQPVASIGAIAVAPSDPATVYVGSGEADMRSDIIHGNGMYRSTDGGATWSRIGLEDSRQIGRILVDPRDPKTLLVAALGHAYGPNDVRGVYRSTDGGATWTRTLFLDRDTGAIDMASDPSMRTVYASLWQTRRPPWSVYAPSNGPGSGLYKSLDGGVTWNAAHTAGLPTEGLGKIGLAVAPSEPNRVYAVVDAKQGGLYRSDDAGSTWRLVDKDKRLWQRGWYFCHVAVDPRDPSIVYVSNTAFYRSTDGGEHFTAIKGSPDGDDFHQLWIDPTDPARMVLGSDQGASVSIDGGRTWSSWFNQPTGQFYRVATDTAFPYRVYGSQQDSGAVALLSRSDHRGIQERDWRPISAGGESDMIAPDPLDRDVVYGGRVDREDFRSSQIRAVSPVIGRPGEWRSEWTMPLAFGPDHALYAAQQIIFRSRDGGNRWEAVSGDLSRREPSAGERRGLVYAIAPSPLRPNTVWAGTDDGLVYVTSDGARSWKDVTPPGITPWSHVDTIEPSHFDPRVAYVAIDRHRLDDDRPYVYATRDGGRTWRVTTSGIPDGSFVYAVREDPVRRGLLYAGTETGVFVSFDDGASWQSLRLNMPIVSVRDISVRDGDLAIATHGRAFWILDDVAPLRDLAGNSAQGTRLFAPREAIRTRPGSDEAESSPPETPVGENPPNGAFIDYVVPASAHGTLTLEILGAGKAIRRWSSADAPKAPDPNDFDFPAYWIEQPEHLAAEPGMHRFVWDFHMMRSDGVLAPPGTYEVRMTLDGRALNSRLALRRDPRVRATDADLRAQAALATEIDALLQRVNAVLEASAKQGAKPNAASGELREGASLLSDLEASVESADAAPTATELSAWGSLRPRVAHALAASPR